MRTVAFGLVVGLACCVVLWSAEVAAQSEIAGVVKDASGSVLPGVTVETASPALVEKTRAAVTDGGGKAFASTTSKHRVPIAACTGTTPASRN